MRSNDSPTPKNSKAQEHREIIIFTVKQIPAGKVASHGQVAKASGLPGYARFVGNCLKQSTASDLPWHRVINAQGKISFAENSEKYKTQQQRLRDEGIEFINNRVAMKKYRWQP